MCLRLRIAPFHLGGLWRYHMSRGSGPCLAIQEGFGAATRLSASNHASPLKRAPVLTCILRLWAAPASEVGSGADTYSMALREPWPIEIKEGISASACSNAHGFPRHARVLPRCLQDVRADGVIMTCNPCGHASQHRAIGCRNAANHLQA
jgi:hypothetical protein